MGIEDRVERVLKKLRLKKFYPFPFARSGHLQTIYGNYWPILKPARPDCFHHVVLPDGDILVMAENRPKNWRPGSRIMLLVHGLTGNHQSHYMQRMCRRMNKKGYLVLRLNLRHSGPGMGLARKPLHAGASHDTRVVLEWIKQKFPDSPVTQIGFSIGGNITLKMAGEDGSKPSGNLDSVVAVSPPVCLESTSQRLSRPENRIFEYIFTHCMRRDAKIMMKLFPDMERIQFPKERTIKAYEKIFAADIGGYSSVQDYYRDCSSINYIPEIKVPSLIISSTDDPVVDNRALSLTPHSNNLDILLTEHGGHIGFLGWGNSYDEVRWSDQAVTRWLEDTLAI